MFQKEFEELNDIRQNSFQSHGIVNMVKLTQTLQNNHKLSKIYVLPPHHRINNIHRSIYGLLGIKIVLLFSYNIPSLCSASITFQFCNIFYFIN